MKTLITFVLLLTTSFSFAATEGGFCPNAAIIAAAGFRDAGSNSYENSFRERAMENIGYGVLLPGNYRAYPKKMTDQTHELGDKGAKVLETFLVVQENTGTDNIALVTVMASTSDWTDYKKTFCETLKVVKAPLDMTTEADPSIDQ